MEYSMDANNFSYTVYFFSTSPEIQVLAVFKNEMPHTGSRNKCLFFLQRSRLVIKLEGSVS